MDNSNHPIEEELCEDFPIEYQSQQGESNQEY